MPTPKTTAIFLSWLSDKDMSPRDHTLGAVIDGLCVLMQHYHPEGLVKIVLLSDAGLDASQMTAWAERLRDHRKDCTTQLELYVYTPNNHLALTPHTSIKIPEHLKSPFKLIEERYYSNPINKKENPDTYIAISNEVFLDVYQRALRQDSGATIYCYNNGGMPQMRYFWPILHQDLRQAGWDSKVIQLRRDAAEFEWIDFALTSSTWAKHQHYRQFRQHFGKDIKQELMDTLNNAQLSMPHLLDRLYQQYLPTLVNLNSEELKKVHQLFCQALRPRFFYYWLKNIQHYPEDTYWLAHQWYVLWLYLSLYQNNTAQIYAIYADMLQWQQLEQTLKQQLHSNTDAATTLQELLTTLDTKQTSLDLIAISNTINTLNKALNVKLHFSDQLNEFSPQTSPKTSLVMVIDLIYMLSQGHITPVQQQILQQPLKLEFSPACLLLSYDVNNKLWSHEMTDDKVITPQPLHPSKAESNPVSAKLELKQQWPACYAASKALSEKILQDKKLNSLFQSNKTVSVFVSGAWLFCPVANHLQHAYEEVNIQAIACLDIEHKAPLTTDLGNNRPAITVEKADCTSLSYAPIEHDFLEKLQNTLNKYSALYIVGHGYFHADGRPNMHASPFVQNNDSAYTLVYISACFLAGQYQHHSQIYSIPRQVMLQGSHYVISCITAYHDPLALMFQVIFQFFAQKCAIPEAFQKTKQHLRGHLCTTKYSRRHFQLDCAAYQNWLSTEAIFEEIKLDEEYMSLVKEEVFSQVSKLDKHQRSQFSDLFYENSRTEVLQNLEAIMLFCNPSLAPNALDDKSSCGSAQIR